MMPYITILKVRKFHQSAISRFGTAGKKQCLLILNRVKLNWSALTLDDDKLNTEIKKNEEQFPKKQLTGQWYPV